MANYIQGNFNAGGTGNAKYVFKTIGGIGDRLSQQVMALPFVATGPELTILFRFTGKEEDASFDFAIYNDGVDAAGGTAPLVTFPNGVKTVDEQIKWLREYLFNEDFDTQWTLYQDRYFPSGVTGVITDIELPTSAGQVSVIFARMTFKRGVVGSY